MAYILRLQYLLIYYLFMGPHRPRVIAVHSFIINFIWFLQPLIKSLTAILLEKCIMTCMLLVL